MKRKAVWLVVTGGMVAALLLASCAPTVTEKEAEKVAPPKETKEEVVVPKTEVVVPKEEANVVKWTGKKLNGTVVEKMIEKPRYGGTHISARFDQPTNFDAEGASPGSASHSWAVAGVVIEELGRRDWTRGPAGTGELSMQITAKADLDQQTLVLAEGWEIPDPNTLVIHIRKGVQYALDPTSEASRLLGGRELTADDVVWSLRRQYGAYPPKIGAHGRIYPYLKDMKNIAGSIYVSPTDKWTVVMEFQQFTLSKSLETVSDWHAIMSTPEIDAKYGNMNDWRNVVGTGPFLLKEYVGASSLSYVKNPNYWGRDPFFPENQLPYIDGFKVLIIPDASTRMAGLRTGKIDRLYDVLSEDAESLLRTNPELKWVEYISYTQLYGVFPRNDIKPFNDVRVRQALWLAINQQELVDVYYGGKAVAVYYPVMPIPEHDYLYTSLEEYPPDVQELYGYYPDKAKQLLAEAGYPQGFKTEIVLETREVDVLSVVKEYWAKIGVDLKLDVKDSTAITGIRTNMTHKEMITGSLPIADPFVFRNLRSVAPGNYSRINDRYIDGLYDKGLEYYADRSMRAQIMKDNALYFHKNAFFIPLPTPNSYVLWQPWLKGYYGVNYVGFQNQIDWTMFIWIDQELKKAMGR